MAIPVGPHTGLREGDVARLGWNELRLTNGTLVLLPNKARR
jgi:integrase